MDIQTQLRSFNLKGYADTSVKYESNGKSGQILTIVEEKEVYQATFVGGRVNIRK